MTVQAIGAIGSAELSRAAAPAAAGDGGAGFANVLAGIVDGVQQQQATAKTLAVQAVSGDAVDIHDATIAATRAQVTLELVAAVRNKMVDGVNEILRMQA